MSTVSNLNVYKNLLNSISIKAPGKWDKHVNLSFSQNNQNKDILLDDYDGLKYEYEGMDNCAPLLNFEGTVLPNRDRLNTEEYCFMPVGGGDDRTGYTYNFNIVGTLNVDNQTKIVSGFTTNDYISLKESFDYSKPYQIIVKFTTPSSIDRYMPIVGTTVPYSLIPFYFDVGSFNLVSYASTEGSNWNLWRDKLIKTLSANTAYTMMFEYDGSAYVWYELVDNEWVELTNYESSSPVYDGGLLKIGNWSENKGFAGTIDLSETSIKVNGNNWWIPEFKATATNTYTIKYPKYTDYIKIGSPTIDKETGIVTGFSSSNYLQLSDHFNPGDSAWEVQTKVKTNSVDSERDIFGTTIDQNLFRIGLAGTVTDRWQILVANNGRWITTSSHYGSYNVLSNTVYWIKAGFDGVDTYYLDYSLDGQTYTRDVTYTSTLKMTPQPSMSTILGSSWDGTVDLSETRILINNEIWWQAKSYVEYSNFNVIGSPTINYGGGIISGFSSNNYLTFTTESTTLTSFEIQIKIQTSANDQEASRPLNSIGGSDTVNGFYIERGKSSKRIGLTYYTGSQYYNFDAKDNVEDGKSYLLKWVWDGNTVKSYYSESDEEHFVLNSEVEHTSFPVAAWSYSMGVRTSDPNYTLFNGSIDLSKTYIKYNSDYIWSAAKEYIKYLPGILSNYTDDGSEVTLNCFALNDKSIILTPDNSHANSVLLGETTIPVHNVYSYDDGVWIDANGGVHIGPAVVVPEVTPEQDDNGGSDYFSPTDPIVN